MTCALGKCTNPADAGECVVCPFAFRCPTCRREPGSRCKRPSEHDCAVHVDRVELADSAAVAQLDIDGHGHDLGELEPEAPPQAEAVRLFEPEAPQMRGQTALAID